MAIEVAASRRLFTREEYYVYRAPDAGAYRDVSRVEGAASVSPRAFPDVVLPLAKIFA